MTDVPPPTCKVYTPYELARGLTASLGDDSDAEWLEPSVGTGVFLRALSDRGVDPERVVAVDLDRDTHPNDDLAETYRGVDFLKWSTTANQRFDRIVGNPPYLEIRTLPTRLRQRAAAIKDLDGNTIGERANTWYAFLLASLRLLRPGGNLGFILPASCEFANYCKNARSQIAQHFGSVDVIRSRRPLFDGVQDGSVVLICRNWGEGNGVIRRTVVRDRDHAIKRLRSFGRGRELCSEPIDENAPRTVRFGDIAEVSIGGVTGHSQYFVLSESQRVNLGLPTKAMRPVLSRSRHIEAASVGCGEWRRLRAQGARVWLFRPGESVVEKHAGVQDYLELSKVAGGCRRDRLKVRTRDPWYRTLLPRAPHAFVSGMARHGPWLCMNEYSGLTATNTLYTIRFKSQMTRGERFAWALAFLTTAVRKQVERRKRVYADGLVKMEPRSILDLQLPKPAKIANPVAAYRRALAHLLVGEEERSRNIADDAVLLGRFPTKEDDGRGDVRL